MYRSAVLVSAILVFARGETIGVQKCIKHPGELPLSTSIEGCSTPPCVLPQLQEAVINLQFKAPYNIKHMRTLATAYLGVGFLQVPVPYDLGANSETCNFITNSYCPVTEDEVLQYTLKMYIESFFPVGISVTVEFRIVDDEEQPITCLRVPIVIGSAVENALEAS